MTFIDKKNICIKYWVHLLFDRTKLACYCYQDGNTSKVSICSSLIINVNGLRWLLNRLTFFKILYLWCSVWEREKEREQVNHSENILLLFVSLFVVFFCFFWRGGGEGLSFFSCLWFFFFFCFCFWGGGSFERERASQSFVLSCTAHPNFSIIFYSFSTEIILI